MAMVSIARRDYAALYGPTDRRRGAPGRYVVGRRDRARPRGARRRMPAWRRQDAARRPRSRARLRQCAGRARHADQQRGDHRSGAGHREGRHRHQGREDRRDRQGRQPRHHGRCASQADLRSGDDRARRRGLDRNAGRYRCARALRQRAAGRARHRVGAHHHDRRVAGSHHGGHRLRRRVERRQDAAGVRAVADELRLPRPRQYAASRARSTISCAAAAWA